MVHVRFSLLINEAYRMMDSKKFVIDDLKWHAGVIGLNGLLTKFIPRLGGTMDVIKLYSS